MIELFNMLGKQRKWIVGYFLHQLIQFFYCLFIFIVYIYKAMEEMNGGAAIYRMVNICLTAKHYLWQRYYQQHFPQSENTIFHQVGEKNSSQTENYLRTMISISSALIPQWFPGDGQFVSETFLLKQIKPTRGTIED